MFYNCESLKELNLSNFNTNKVYNMGDMFYECQNLTELNISKFKINKETNTSNMFQGCVRLKKTSKIRKIEGDNSCICF